jgi:hypothetical protein
VTELGQSNRDGHGSTGSATLTVPSGASELSQLALWMSASLAGMVTAVLTARTPVFRSIMRRLGVTPKNESRPSMRALRPTREQSLPMLAEAIVGNNKSAIESVFGPPRSAVVMNSSSSTEATYWQAETWYYPLPKNDHLAMAIEFNGDDARRVEFLRAPAI